MRNKNLINRPLTDKVNDVQANPTSHKPNISVHGRLSEEEQETMCEDIEEFLEYKEHGDIDLSELNNANLEESHISLTEALQMERGTLEGTPLPDATDTSVSPHPSPLIPPPVDEDTSESDSGTPLPDTPVSAPNLPSTKLRAYKIIDKGFETIRPAYKWKISYFVDMDRRQAFRPGEITVYSEEEFEKAYLALIRATLTKGEVAVIICEDNRYNSVQITIKPEHIKAFNNLTEDSMDKKFELIVGNKTHVYKVSDLLEKKPLTLLNITPDHKFQALENSVEELMLRRAV